MTRTARLFLTAVFLLGTLFTLSSPASAQPGYGQPQTINCSSNDGKRNWCNIGNARDAQLVRQISGSPCVRNNTWGIDSRGLWVDNGCRADFTIGGGGLYPQPGPGQGTIRCSSDNGKRNWCNIGNARDVRLVNQVSGSPCVRNSTWGVDSRGLWVDNGCRADFAFGGGGGGYYPQPGGPGQGTIRCSSDNGKRNWCNIGNARDAQLVNQVSGSPCVRGSTWGVDNQGIWVDNGCRADFAFGGGGGYRPPSSQPFLVTCSSNDGKRNWCDIGGRRDIRLNRQISGSACIQDQTWGIDNRGIWVDRGCRAEFSVR
jgi:hypothetical protein